MSIQLEHVYWPCERKSPDSLRFICDPVGQTGRVRGFPQYNERYVPQTTLRWDGNQQWILYSKTKQASTTTSTWCAEQCVLYLEECTFMFFHSKLLKHADREAVLWLLITSVTGMTHPSTIPNNIHVWNKRSRWFIPSTINTKWKHKTSCNFNMIIEGLL